MPPKKRQKVEKSGDGAGQSKRTKAEKGKEKEKVSIDKRNWPPEFQKLDKIFKTLNTFLAFCSSRKHLAMTFPVIRSSVEDLLKEPLDLERIAELKALLPDLIKFAYIPKAEHATTESQPSSNKDVFTNAMEQINSKSHAYLDRDEEHVLVLEFVEGTKSSGSKRAELEPSNLLLQMPPALTPAELKKLVLRRNERFEAAVQELLSAVSAGETAAALLRAAAKEHLPVLPSLALLSEKMHLPGLPQVPTPSMRGSISTILGNLDSYEWYTDQIAFQKSFEAKLPDIGQLSRPLSQSVQDAIESVRSIKSLYSHQAAAINSVMAGRDVVISTSTASGKSVIYQLPLLKFLEDDADATAMLIFPTKALAQDQKLALQQLIAAVPSLSHLKVETFDGDTPKDARIDVKESASVIFTNFDMIHAAILPHEETWRRFLKYLRLIAVDELHYYSGVFGSHVAQIMRRLRRVCAALGNRHIRFISCSATMREPLEHMQAIFGVEFADVIQKDGSPSGPRDFVVWRPPLIDREDPSLGRDSALKQSVQLMRHLMLQGVRTILFCKFRKMCEQAMKLMRSELTGAGYADLLDKVVAYRGGYSAEDRRRIERDAFGGKLLGIVATNALELGVDIGVLDAVIMLGFPYTLANMRQQAGRAGRRARDALVVLITDQNPIDQHYLLNPEELFSSPTEPLAVDLNSSVILEAHLQCASHEMPLCLGDESYFGPLFRGICEAKYHPDPRFLPYPSQHIAIRGTQEEHYLILEVPPPGSASISGGKFLEEIEFSRALFETYEGGVFLHQGKTYVVQEVSHDSRIAKVYKSDVNWTTKPRDLTYVLEFVSNNHPKSLASDVEAICTKRIRGIRGTDAQAFYGDIDIQTTIYGFYKIRNGKRIEAVSLETPPFLRKTVGWWLDIPKQILDIMRNAGLNVAEGIHSACHAILNQFAMQRDLKTECKLAVKEYKSQPSRRKRPARLIFYEAAGAGVVSVKAFDMVSILVHAALETIESCKCPKGCNKCIDGPFCKEGNEVSSKVGAQLIIRGLLGMPINLNAIPPTRFAYDPEMDTIVEAPRVPSAGNVVVEDDM